MTCRLMADDVRTGFLSFLPGNEAAVKGLHAMEWEPGKEGEKLRGHADDAADGAVYGWRLAKKLYEGTYVGPAPDPLTPQQQHDVGVAQEFEDDANWLEEMGFQ
jgi:hypothetical protein